MSGPKSGNLTVDWESVSNAEAEEARELRELEKQRQRDEAQQQRLERLREKEARKQAREAESRKREAELAEADRKRALETYNQVQAQLDAALAARGDFEQRFPGIDLPPRPEVDKLTSSADIDAIRMATERLRIQARDYQQNVDRVLMKHHQDAAAANATATMQSWSMQFRRRAIRRASDVIVALESNSTINASREQAARLTAYTNEAKRLIAILDTGNAEIPEQLLGRLDEVFASTSDHQGRAALELLKQEVVAEQARRADGERRLAQARQAIENQRKRALIADQISGILEDMGYSVSGIDETAFVQDGQLYAWNKNSPAHALSVDLDSTGQGITVSPLRITGEHEQTSGAADAHQKKVADTEFDTVWCNSGKGGIKEFKTRLKDRKIGFSYARKNKPGDEVGVVAEHKLGKRIQTARNTQAHIQTLKTRERK